MSLDKEQACGCGHDHHEEHVHEEATCGCGNSMSSCGCGHDHSHDHEQTVTLTLEDNTQLVCPVLDTFSVNEQEYLALLHPEDETALLYRIFSHPDDSVELEAIDDDEEFNLVSKTFLAMMEEEA